MKACTAASLSLRSGKRGRRGSATVASVAELRRSVDAGSPRRDAPQTANSPARPSLNGPPGTPVTRRSSSPTRKASNRAASRVGRRAASVAAGPQDAGSRSKTRSAATTAPARNSCSAPWRCKRPPGSTSTTKL